MGGYGHMPNLGQQQAPDPDQQRVLQQQQDFQRNLQSFISGLNCSIGLSYGVAQISYLGSKAAHFFMKAIKVVLGKIF